MSDLLTLDPEIRNWVLIPIVLITMLVGIGRSMISQLVKSDSAVDADKVKHMSLIQRAQRLRGAQRFIPPAGFAMRKAYLCDKDAGMLRRTIEVDPMKNNPMSNPDGMMNMLKGNMSMMLPHILMMGWINYFFSGFVLVKLPFPVTSRFKSMLQRGVDLGSLDVSYVSSLSWYFLVMFGLRSFYSLVLGSGHEDMDAKMMQAQMGMGGGGQPQQFDPNKHFEREADQLEIVSHEWVVGGAEKRLLQKRLR
jgi:hypothetical protein